MANSKKTKCSVLCVGSGLGRYSSPCPDNLLLPAKLGVLQQRCEKCFQKHLLLVKDKHKQ